MGFYIFIRLFNRVRNDEHPQNEDAAKCFAAEAVISVISVRLCIFVDE